MAHVHTVRPGDCLSSIAFESGHTCDTIWLDERNADLRARRGNPNVLQAGDEVLVPSLRQKTVEGETGRRHVFRRRGVPEVLRVRLLDEEGKPFAGKAYTFTIDGGAPRDGTTDGEGSIREWISPGAVAAELVVRCAEDDERRYRLQLGHLPPVTTPAGVHARLRNLGYTAVPKTGASGEPGADLPSAIRRFQIASGLEPTGEADAATRDALERRHGV